MADEKINHDPQQVRPNRTNDDEGLHPDPEQYIPDPDQVDEDIREAEKLYREGEKKGQKDKAA